MGDPDLTAFQIKQTTWQQKGNALLRIRYRVFVEEQGVPAALEHDDHDHAATHLLATCSDGGEVATARLLDDGHIGRMAVLSGFRGQGIGSAMLKQLIDIAVSRSIDRLFLHAQCTAIPFYERAGFVVEGSVFKDAGIDHRTMILHTTVKPD